MDDIDRLKGTTVDERWVGVEEVATHLGVARDTVYRWVESRGLPARRVGRLLRFRLSEVDAWVAGKRTDRVAEPRLAWAPAQAPARIIDVEPAIDEMVRRIVEQFDPERVILFGSYARGNAGPDSDVDLLVVMHFQGSKRAKQVEIRVSLHDIHVPKDIIVASPQEVEKYRDLVGTIIRPALREGITLYERAA
jgi:excisionase family DNA binding protein